MEESPRRTKVRRFIVELNDLAINEIFLVYLEIESKSNALA
jgi:hypothetical protein